MNYTGLLRALSVGALATGLVYGAGQVDVGVDLSRASDDAAARDASAPVNTTLVCPGPDRPGTSGYETDEQAVSVVSASMPTVGTSAAGKGAVRLHLLPSGAEADDTPLGQIATADTVRIDRIDQPAGLRLSGESDLAAGVAGLQTWIDDAPTVGGLGAALCTPVLKDAWIPLGGNDPGRLGRILLTNPSGTAVSVDVQVVGSRGAVADKGSSHVVVPARHRKVIEVGDFGADLSGAMVHVVADAAVAVAGVDVLLKGEISRGQAGAAPARPGREVILPDARVSAEGTSVRIAVPGEREVSARVRVVGRDGTVVLDEVRDVAGGAAEALVIKGVPAGSYAIRVTAQEPVVAAAVDLSAGDGRADFGWSTASPTISDRAGTPLPTLPGDVTTALTLFAPDDPAELELTSAGGRPEKVRVMADRPTRIDVTGRRAVWLRVTSGSLHAALTMSGGAQDAPRYEVLPVQVINPKAGVRDSTAERD